MFINYYLRHPTAGGWGESMWTCASRACGLSVVEKLTIPVVGGGGCAAPGAGSGRLFLPVDEPLAGSARGMAASLAINVLLMLLGGAVACR